MGKRDKRVDAVIVKAQPFAKPILKYIREAVHDACPDCEETIKWSMPHFDYHGKTLCGMAPFKQHAAFVLWKARLIVGDDDARTFRRVTSVSELPPKKTLAGYIRTAMALTDAGVKIPKRRTTAPRKPLRTPPDLAAALKKNNRARTAFGAFPPSRKREYIEWITEAKADETRARRLAAAIAWIAEGKPRNWKYMRK